MKANNTRNSKGPNKSTLTERGYLLAAFLEGAAVLSVEIIGAKMLSPFFGSSLLVWTSVIGITIAFLTLGYYIGGTLSKRNNLQKILSYAFAIAALLMALMPWTAFQLYHILIDAGLYTGSIIAAIILLGPPMLALGTSSPIIIQQLTSEVFDAGKKAGLVYAISTLGGILITFFTGFILIPYWGISTPIILISVLTLVFAIKIYFEKLHYAIFFFFFLALLNFFAGFKTVKSSGVSVPYISEGMLGQLKVLDAIDSETQNPIRYLLINGIPQTKIINNEMAVSDWGYVHLVAATASVKRNSASALLFGFGGGSIANELARMNIKTDVVEIDSRMTDIAKKYFYFNDSLITSFTIDDARHYMRVQKKKYDLIVFDVLNGEVQPSYVFTQESFAELKNLLNPGGMVLIEFQELIEHKGPLVYQSICNTLLAAGYKAYYHISPGEVSDIIITASQQDIDYSAYKKENLSFCCASLPHVDDFLKKPNEECKKPFNDALVLVDDKPMIDILNAETIRSCREWSLALLRKAELDTKQRIFK